jgi:hypothetical protein
MHQRLLWDAYNSAAIGGDPAKGTIGYLTHGSNWAKQAPPEQVVSLAAEINERDRSTFGVNCAYSLLRLAPAAKVPAELRFKVSKAYTQLLLAQFVSVEAMTSLPLFNDKERWDRAKHLYMLSYELASCTTQKDLSDIIRRVLPEMGPSFGGPDSLMAETKKFAETAP